MRKKLLLFFGVAVLLTAVSCADAGRQQEAETKQAEETETEEIEEAAQTETEGLIAGETGFYTIPAFSEELSLSVDGRSFLAEDPPENEGEEAVFRYWMAEFLQDTELYRESTADQAAAESVQQEYVQKKHQLQEFSLHVLKTVSEEEKEEAERAFSCTLEEAAQKYGLTESLLVQAEWTEERKEPVNYGNGSHTRYYLCGRTQEEAAWRIYEFGMM